MWIYEVLHNIVCYVKPHRLLPSCFNYIWRKNKESEAIRDRTLATNYYNNAAATNHGGNNYCNATFTWIISVSSVDNKFSVREYMHLCGQENYCYMIKQHYVDATLSKSCLYFNDDTDPQFLVKSWHYAVYTQYTA